MHLSMILTIFRKDVRDAIRDSRVIAALLIPLAIGLFYNYTFDDDEFELPPVEVAYVTESDTRLFDVLEEVTAGSADLSLTELDSAIAVQERVADEDAEIGLVIPSGFDQAVEAGESPTLQIYLQDEPTSGTNYVVAALEQSLRSMAGQLPPANVQISIADPAGDDTLSIFEELGPRQYFVLAAVIMLVGMNAMLVVPLILAEEAEKKTLDALVLVASYADVVIAKAMVGLFYVGVSAGVLVLATSLGPEAPLLFAIAVALCALSLVGIGLLIGSLFTNANQVNTWAGFFLLPVIAPAFMVGFPVPDAIETLLSFLPTSQAMRLLVNAQAGQDLFPDAWLSLTVLVVWAVVTFALVALRLSRREA